MTFSGNQYRTRFKPASLPSDFQMRITFEADDRAWIPSGPSGSQGIDPPPELRPADWEQEQKPLVVVNVFDGGERHKVEVRFDQGEFVEMDNNPPRFGLTDGQPNRNLDPYIVGLLEQHAGTDDEPASPEPSSHLWTAAVPKDLGPGTHTVTIRSTDPYNQRSQASQTFEVASP